MGLLFFMYLTQQLPKKVNRCHKRCYLVEPFNISKNSLKKFTFSSCFLYVPERLRYGKIEEVRRDMHEE